MCFSETASFSTSALLVVLSIFSLKAARKAPKYTSLALIPLFFAIQQFSEGVQWHFLGHAPFAKYVYAFFAFAWWPFWIPFALLIAEDNPTRKTAFGVLTFLGFFLGAYGLYHVLTHPVQVAIVENSIQYTAGISESTIWPYFFLTLFPWFCSSLKGTTFLGIVIAISTFATSYFYYNFFTSVWCFFAALLSGLVVITLKIQKKV